MSGHAAVARAMRTAESNTIMYVFMLVQSVVQEREERERNKRSKYDLMRRIVW